MLRVRSGSAGVLRRPGPLCRGEVFSSGSLLRVSAFPSAHLTRKETVRIGEQPLSASGLGTKSCSQLLKVY
jgi:hypothetical protein